MFPRQTTRFEHGAVSIVLVCVASLVLVGAQQFCLSPSPICDCFIDSDGLKVINCRYKGLTGIPRFSRTGEIYDKIIFTSAEPTGTCVPESGCNNITSLPADSFANLNVKILDLRNNAITSIDLNAFRGLENTLNVLLLEGDGATEPPYRCLSTLRGLLSIHLEHFRQSHMTDTNTQLDFPKLVSLTLKRIVGLETIAPTALSSVPNVSHLFLENLHSLKMLPVAAILNLPKLQVLNVFDTKINRIYGESFLRLDDLQKLELEHNVDLVTIDAHVFRGVDDTLQFLAITASSLSTSVLREFQSYNWTSLKQLSLSNNPIATIPDGAFRTMKSLDILELESMGLTSVSEKMFAGLSSLQKLDLGYNKITFIPNATFQNSPELNYLSLNDQDTNKHPINFATNAFSVVHKTIQQLMLERNAINISQLWHQISKFSNLTYLDLEGDGISEIPDFAFANLVNLTHLDLSNNNIHQLKQESLYGPTQTLSVLQLMNNQLATVDECVLHGFVLRPIVQLVGNPLVCDCRLAWLYDWVATQNDTIAVALTGSCAAPAALKDQSFFQLNRSQLCNKEHRNTTCRDLHSISTTPGTIKPSTSFHLFIINKTMTSVTVSWSVNDVTNVTGYIIEVREQTQPQVPMRFVVNKNEVKLTITSLVPGRVHVICMTLEYSNGAGLSPVSCKTVATDQWTSTFPTISTTMKPNKDVIVG